MPKEMSPIRRQILRWTLAAAAVAFIGAAGLIAADNWIMPSYTNYQEGVTIPDVTKLSYDEASELLSTYGLRYEVLDRRSHAAYPANYIIDQAPVAGQVVKPNRKIYLTVNTTEAPTATVPDLTNMSLRNARIQLQNSQLQPGVVSYESSRYRNTVLRQSLPPGEVVPQGTSIDLAVSDGLGDRMVDVPDLHGEPLPDAQRKIREAGLRIGDVRFERQRDTQPNTVIGVTPDQPSLREGESLDLVISERFDVQEESESGVILEEQDSLESRDPEQPNDRPEDDNSLPEDEEPDSTQDERLPLDLNDPQPLQR
ncbi:MAG: PASTA domain-containing protein [Bacteroidota bacterium]